MANNETQFVIKFNREETEDTYGEEMFEEIITNLVEEAYIEKKADILKGYETGKEILIKKAAHTIKTNAKYLFEMGFADACQKIEDWCTKDLSWEKLNENKDWFLAYLDALYLEGLRYYKEIKESKGEPVDEKYLNLVPDVKKDNDNKDVDISETKEIKEETIVEETYNNKTINVALSKENSNDEENYLDKECKRNICNVKLETHSESEDSSVDISPDNDSYKKEILYDLPSQKRSSILETIGRNESIKEEDEDNHSSKSKYYLI